MGAAEAGAGPGPGVRPRHPGEEAEETGLHWAAERGQLAPWLQPCQAVPRGWASPPSQLQVPSWGQQIPRGGQAGPRKLPASLPQPQPHPDAGVPG